MSTSFQSLPVTKPSTYPGDPFPAPPCPFRGPDAPRVTVLVPALNEADNLPFVLVKSRNSCKKDGMSQAALLA